MNAIEINKLNEILAEQGCSFPEQQRLGNSFATACFLHALGHEKAGRKLINELFDQLGRDRRKTYFNQLLNSLHGNEKTYGLAVTTHSEIHELVKTLTLEI